MFQESLRPKCPNCRIHIRDRDAHPVFLELVDSKAVLASSLVDGLDKMDHETPLLSIKKAGQKLGKVLQGPQPEPNAMVKRDSLRLISILLYFITFPKIALIKAIKDFNERIIPLFTKVEVQSHQIIALGEDFLESRQETENLQDQLSKAKVFQTKSVQL